jgi:Tol biopolymer transport system component
METGVLTLPENTVLENRYRVEALLTQGGMGSIYRAYDLKLDIPVAIKENSFLTPEGIKQFEQEARILARLHHPNLPRVIDHFSFEDKQYLVMDFIEGQDLWEMVESRQQPLAEKQVLDYIIQICDAVNYLHRQQPPIIHRDIKPQNIKITPDGRAVLVDFGIAKVADRGHRTRTGAKAITPGFSPPEQYGGMGTTPLSDIYSLGATLYAGLTGHYPPDSISLLAGGVKFEPPNMLNANLSAQVSQAVEHAMQVKQELRPQAISTWQQELKAIQAGQVVTRIIEPDDEKTIVLTSERQTPLPTPPAPLTAARPAPSNIPWFWAGLAGLALAVAIAAIAFLLGRSGTQAEPFDAEAILVALAATATAQAQTGLAGPNLDLEATLVALAATATVQAQSQPLSTEEAATPTATPEATATALPPSATPTPEPTATEAPPTATPSPPAIIVTQSPPAATPSPTPALRITFISNRAGTADVFVMNADGTGQTNLTNDSINDDLNPAWAPDGRRIAFASHNAAERPTPANTSIRLVPVEGGEVTTLATQSSHPVWSPDGSRLAVYGAGDHIFTIDARTGQGVQLTQGHGYNPSWSPDSRRLIFDDRSDLYIINNDGTGLTRLTGSAADEIQPAWSPDGQRIAFVSNGEGNNEIYVMSLAETNSVRLTHHPADDLSPVWSPDGTQIIFATHRDGNWEIYSMNADGSDPRNLTNHPGADNQPATPLP